ncbi:hypothetical protein E2C01_042686 [Portunus trituberculatus]|uniref:CUB domain-containing protein n=1 Tax=Portunus trituberculatus TaxID=210409 RepID=A0A5B7FMF2_PORTR|nr:hypothetical protein [Portunus trituberculatus]
MNFTTDETITAPGFNISIKLIRTDCHQVITHAAAGETGTITAAKNQRACEYRIVAPAGSQVRIDGIQAKIATSTQCRKDRLLVNGNSERMYPLDTSSNICGYTTVTTPITSSTGEMYLAYEKVRRWTRGFNANYTII